MDGLVSQCGMLNDLENRLLSKVNVRDCVPNINNNEVRSIT